jgi:hypothetical protein
MRQARKPILLSTLSFIGFVTCDRVLQSGIEELHYAERIARLRAYYFDFAPELTHYLASVPPSRRLAILGLRSGYWPAFRTTAGMIGVVTAVLTGSAAGLLATVAAGHSAVAGFLTGGMVGVAVLVALMWFQLSAWVQAHRQRLFEDEQEQPDAGVMDKIDVSRCHVANTRGWPPFRDHHDGDRPEPMPPSRRQLPAAVTGPAGRIPDVMRLSQCQQADRPSPVSFRS